MKNTTVRTYQPTDENTLRKLAAALYRYQFPHAANYENTHPEITKHFSGLQDIHQHRGVILCALRDNEIHGFVCLQGPIEPGTEQASSEHHYVFMSDLFVEEVSRNQGIGSALIKASDDWAKERGCHKIALKVLAENEVAVRFYERNQYEPRFIVMDKTIK